MTWTSALAIYFLFWFFSVFLVLPFGVRTAEEAGAELVPGQAESAPHTFEPGKIALRVTIVGTTLWALFLANYNYGWITVEMLDWAR
jgi:predicted secreted protein